MSIQAYRLRLRFNEWLSIVIGRDFRAFESLPNQIQYLFRPTMSMCNPALGCYAGAKIQKKREKIRIKNIFLKLSDEIL